MKKLTVLFTAAALMFVLTAVPAVAEQQNTLVAQGTATKEAAPVLIPVSPPQTVSPFKALEGHWVSFAPAIMEIQLTETDLPIITKYVYKGRTPGIVKATPTSGTEGVGVHIAGSNFTLKLACADVPFSLLHGKIQVAGSAEEYPVKFYRE